MAGRNLFAKDVVEALFERRFGFLDSDSSDEDGDTMHGYLGSTFILPQPAEAKVDSVDEDNSTDSEEESEDEESSKSSNDELM